MAFGIKWLKPELDEGKYWVHVAILALIVQYILGQFGHDVGGLFTIHTVHFGIAIAIADTIAHTLLQLD